MLSILFTSELIVESAGAQFGLMGDLFSKLYVVMEHGLLRDAATAATHFTARYGSLSPCNIVMTHYT